MKRPSSRTLADLRALGRDPFAIFRAEEALAIDAAWLGRVMEGAPLAFWSEEDDGEDGPGDPECPPYEIVDGVAVYEIEGPLSQRGYWCWQGYDTVARDVEMAVADSRVRSILLRINSPGGAAAGCFEGARRIRAALDAGKKRCVAFADEMAYSAAYALAVCADEIVIPEPGGVGSVGVIAGLSSYAKALSDQGVDVRVFTSGKEKADGSPLLPISPGAAARTQARVDELAGIFTRWVGARRGMDPADVQALEAGVRYGRAAVTAGLADRIASWGDLVAQMRAANAPQTPRPVGATTAARVAAPRITTMDEKIAEALAAATGHTDPEAQIGALAAIKAKADERDAAVARVAALEEATEKRDRADLIAKGEAAGQLTTESMRAWAAAQPLATLRAFLEAAPSQVPQGRVDPPAAPADEECKALAAKGYGSLTDSEKHRLYTSNRALFDRLRAEHERTQPAG